ncbi:MAG: PqqD family protein [Candidatus Thermoplasmatota archaeon]|nr:PqqD family protein [Candidatus Thermoplasmatota archaeon]
MINKARKAVDIMNSIPIKQAVSWSLENGRVVIVVKKHFTKLEKFLQKYLKGPEYVKVPLDTLGSAIWLLCDGEHTIKDICDEMSKSYKEAIEPAVPRITKFLAMLLRRNFIRLEK